MVKWIVIGLATLLSLMAGFLISLTFPAVGTPVTEWALRKALHEDTEVGKAWIRFAPAPILETRQLSVPSLIEADAVTGRLRLSGLFPGTALFSLVSAREGRAAIDLTQQGGADPSAWIDDIALEDVALSVRREAAVTNMQIASGRASFERGDIAFLGTAGGQEISFDGKGALMSPDTIEGDLALDAPEPNALADALGIALPNLPPLDITADLTIADTSWTLETIDGRIGDSLPEGRLLIGFARARPLIDADLRFDPLDFDDLGVIFGLPSETENGTENRVQRRANRAYARSDRLLPRARIAFDRLAEVDARLDIAAERVIDAPYPIKSAALDATLENALLTIENFKAKGERGTLTMSGSVDARREPAVSELAGNLEDAFLSEIVPREAARGPLFGEFDLRLVGNSFREAFADASGDLSLWSTNAEVIALYVEAAGLDLGEALALYFEDGEGERTFTEAPCMVLRFDMRAGQAILSPGVIDTEDSLILIRGHVDLATERLDLSIDADAKDLSLGDLLGQVEITGTLLDPEAEIPKGAVAGQAAIAAGLGAIAGPLAALPFLEPGEEEGAPCGRLVRRANAVLENR